MMIAFLAATILMAGGAATTQAAPDTAKPKLTAANTLICKSEPVFGTRLSTRKCRTVEQIAQQRQEDQANLDKIQHQSQPAK